MIGILMLDTAFPRVIGDIGNPESFDFPVRYHVVPGASPDAIVRGDTAPWVQRFIEAGRALVAEGCTSLVTTCGFLTLLRDEVSTACGVPVVSSSLELVPGLLAEGARPGILTISQTSLSDGHLRAASVPLGIPVHGVDNSHFAAAILNNQTTLDTQVAEDEVVTGALRLCDAHPEVDVIVLECTNMPPYQMAIEAATGRRVVSILNAMDAMNGGSTAL
ncbi:MAG: aspartate/glutamate racemase family protein [Pseudomonadota bacterium]